MTIAVTLPWPPAGLSPNGQHGHWSRKAGPAARYKADCAVLCRSLPRIDADAVEVTVVFHPPSLRRYDLDNQLARIKQPLDAVSEAIGVDDGAWRSMTLERGAKMKGGAVEIYIHPVEGCE